MRKHLPSVKRRGVKTALALLFFLSAPFLCPDGYSDAASIGELAERGELSGDVEKLILQLDALEKGKIRINTAGADELRLLPWLDGSDIHDILEHRKKTPFRFPEQLAEVIGRSKAESVAPYISCEMKKGFRKAKAPEGFSGSFTCRVFREFPRREGVLNGKYAPAAEKLYNRLQLAFSSYTLGFVQERDIGEPELFDFTSLSIGAADLGIVKRAVLGNYELNFGQGLIIGQGRYYVNSADASGGVRLSSKRLSPYTSSSESGFFQGGAIALDLAPVELTVFYSADRVDAIINKKSGMITSFDDSGSHRTVTERLRHDNVAETVYGANLLYRFSSGPLEGRIGGSWVRCDYGIPLKIFGGSSSSTLAGIEGEAAIGRLGVFGEAAWAERPAKGFSWNAGVEWKAAKGVSTVLAVRDYSPGYYSPFASAYAERGEQGGNEQGVYAGTAIRLSDRFSISGYYDWFRFPALDDNTRFPSDGHDFRVFAAWSPSRSVSCNLQVQHKYKEEEKNQGTSKNPVWTALPKITERCRMDFGIELPGHFHARTLGEIKKAKKIYLAGDETNYGWLLYGQGGYSGGRFSLKTRFTLFNIEDYDAAIYVYEDDLPQTFNIGMYNGRGKSLLVTGSWQASKNFRLAGRFEKVWYSGRESYGDGSDRRDTGAPASLSAGAYLKF